MRKGQSRDYAIDRNKFQAQRGPGNGGRGGRRGRLFAAALAGVGALIAAAVSVDTAVADRHGDSAVYLGAAGVVVTSSAHGTGSSTSTTAPATSTSTSSTARAAVGSAPPPHSSAPPPSSAPPAVPLSSAVPPPPDFPSSTRHVSSPVAPASTHSAPRVQASKAPPPPAPTSTTVAISGSVTCLSGNAVTGVWIDVAQGAGFSPWWPTANPATATYAYTLPVSEPYALHVGCGGTQPSWAVATTTPPVSGTQNSFNCDDISGDADYGACVRR